jgi:2-iminobutanoate/2-iminopropanoate deaminase
MTFLNPREVHAPLGPYSHTAVVAAGTELVFVSGQVGMHPDGSIPAAFADQTELTFQNLRSCLAAHGLGGPRGNMPVLRCRRLP